MSRQCQVTGKKRMVGNNRSHAENKTKRTFEVNVHYTMVYSELLKRRISLKISAAGLRTLDHKGGFDAFIAGTAKTKLDPALRVYKAQVEKAMAEKTA
jgi:large subunit ribosomal protein L28